MKDRARNRPLAKCPTGIAGLDEITQGGLPAGRPTLLCGGAGCGKTVLGLEFVSRGASQFDEPGLFVAFEEAPEELLQNVGSLGFDLDRLVKQGRVAFEHVRIDRTEIEEAGEYDLEGLFIRLGAAIDAVGARRVVLDTLESLFGRFDNQRVLRSELQRLFRWLKERGVTALVTAERGEGTLTRHGLEEYVSDCVILLDHRVEDQNSVRRLRVVKYRGSVHGADEYPFLIRDSGFSVLPVTSLGLTHPASSRRTTSGVPALDAMLKGGYHRGSTVLVSGSPGSGKSTLGAAFAAAACRGRERALYLAFEESPEQIVRNMASVGLDLRRWLDRGRLRIVSTRATQSSLEMHLARIAEEVNAFRPQAVVIDPLSGFTSGGSPRQIQAMLTRLVDLLKGRGITGVFTSLVHGAEDMSRGEAAVSSLVDTWIALRDAETNGEFNRGLHVLKSRGTAHSNQVREFQLTGRGIVLRDAYLGPSGMVAGTARVAQEARDRAEDEARRDTAALRRLRLGQKRRALEARISALRAEFAAEEDEDRRLIQGDRRDDARRATSVTEMRRSRRVGVAARRGRG